MLSSHGMREKGVPFNENLNIPFMLYSPLLDENQRNTKSNYIGSLVDLIPTVIRLNNFNDCYNQFNGESLIKLNSNNKFESKIREDNLEKGALHLQNATEALLTYFSFSDWYINDATLEQRNNTKPNNFTFFTYKYAFIMNQTLFESKLYKFGLFYSLKDIIEYNILYNKITFNSIDLDLNLSKSNNKKIINLNKSLIN